MQRRFAVLATTLVALSELLFASSAVWLDIPFFRQEKNGCGAASVAMVVEYWHQRTDTARAGEQITDLKAIQSALFSKQVHGIYASAIEDYLHKQGFRTFTFKGEWLDLDRHLQKGRPLIVALQPSARSELHYVVVAGLDPQANVVLLNDPARRKLLKIDRSEFEKEWNACGSWTLLAVPQPGR